MGTPAEIFDDDFLEFVTRVVIKHFGEGHKFYSVILFVLEEVEEQLYLLGISRFSCQTQTIEKLFLSYQLLPVLVELPEQLRPPQPRQSEENQEVLVG